MRVVDSKFMCEGCGNVTGLRCSIGKCIGCGAEVCFNCTAFEVDNYKIRYCEHCSCNSTKIKEDML
jgi:hypothetical protein